jgi:hypothetical protein
VKRPPALSEEDARRVLYTNPADITLTILRDWFAWKQEIPPHFDPQAELTVPTDLRRLPVPPPGDRPAGTWTVRDAPGWSAVLVTTVGRVVANGLPFSRSAALRASQPYINAPWDEKVVRAVEQRLVDGRLDGTLDADDVAWAIDRLQWLGYAPTSFIASSMTIDTIRLPPKTAALKHKILAGERGDRLREGNLKEVAATEKELLTSAREELAGVDPGMDIYESGARGSFGNNYKNTAVMRGAIRRSDDPSKITVSTASLDDGIPKAEMPAYADMITQASYARSISTAQGGYILKQMNAAFQSLALDPSPTSDCGTARLLDVFIDDPREYLYRFYRDGSTLREITPALAEGLKGRSVRMRSPLFCASKGGICSRCAGTLFYRVGINQIGLLAGRIGTSMMASSLRSFHDVTLKTTKISLPNHIREL